MPNVPQNIPTTGFNASARAVHLTISNVANTLPTTGYNASAKNFTILTKQLINNLTATSGLQLVRGQDFPRGDGNR